ncbi:MAG TPA: MauE/DoxX family redox-associated membrane protein [Pyrinomonadaceae bacterium]|jgi:uncharacterized membrane protein YphA (DoxX/SURF4 family)
MPDLSIFSDPQAVLLYRLVLGGVMSAAGAGKVMSRAEFEKSLRNQFRFSLSRARFIAYWLPRAEIGLGLLLVGGVFVRLASFLSLLMLAAFSLLLVRMRLRGSVELNCNCFGTNSRPKRVAVLIQRNLLLIALGVLVYSHSDPFLLLWSRAGGVRPGDAAATALTAAGLFLLVYLSQGINKIRAMRSDFARQERTLITPTVGRTSEAN